MVRHVRVKEGELRKDSGANVARQVLPGIARQVMEFHLFLYRCVVLESVAKLVFQTIHLDLKRRYYCTTGDTEDNRIFLLLLSEELYLQSLRQDEASDGGVSEVIQ